MFRRITSSLAVGVGVGLAAMATPALAQQPGPPVPGLTAFFTQPTGTGTQTSSFDVYIRLAVAANSAAFTYDGSNLNTFGLPAGFPIPTTGSVQSGPNQGQQEAFDHFTGGTLNNSFSCSGTFTNVCDPGAYAFNFNFDAPSLVGLQQLTIQPGSFMDFLFGTFTPVGGSAAPGTYTFYDALPIVEFFGVDANGESLEQDITLAHTCGTSETSCAFTRTVTGSGVTATPEPATLGLMVLGLSGLGLVARRRRTVA